MLATQLGSVPATEGAAGKASTLQHALRSPYPTPLQCKGVELCIRCEAKTLQGFFRRHKLA